MMNNMQLTINKTYANMVHVNLKNKHVTIYNYSTYSNRPGA